MCSRTCSARRLRILLSHTKRYFQSSSRQMFNVAMFVRYHPGSAMTRAFPISTRRISPARAAADNLFRSRRSFIGSRIAKFIHARTLGGTKRFATVRIGLLTGFQPSSQKNVAHGRASTRFHSEVAPGIRIRDKLRTRCAFSASSENLIQSGTNLWADCCRK